MIIADAAERAEALDPRRSFCVTAPAGSGKTELLIQRFLGLLSRVERPEQVLAITFTRKAAAEMHERVVHALEEAVADAPCSGDHERVTRDLALDALAWSERLDWHLLRDVSRLNIKTIDSFCAALTRQMPILSEFGGQARIVDRAEELYAEAVGELFGLLAVDHAVSRDLGQLLLHFDNDWDRLRALLVKMLARRDQWYDYTGAHQSSEASEAALSATVDVLVNETLADVADALAPFQAQLHELVCYAGEHLGDPIPERFPSPVVAEMDHWRAVHRLLLKADGDWRRSVNVRNGFPAGKGEPAERKAQLKDLIEAMSAVPDLRERLDALAWLPDMRENTASWQLVLALSHVLPTLAACLLLVFRRRGVVDHSQVALSALQALGEDDAPTELALRLDYRVEHILVDEFQDTAINQYKLVTRLTRGWGEYNEMNPEAPRTLFIVGDGMQSIYGFRDANVGLFLQAREQGFNGVRPTSLALRCNFRSDRGIVEWVNEAFGRAFPAEDDVRRGQVSFTAAVAVRPAVHLPAVELHGFTGDAAIEQEAGRLVALIREGLEDASVGSIAILGRSRSQLSPVLQKLRAEGIAYAAQEMDPLAGSPAIVDLMSLCRVLSNPADRVAWFALLRAPWCGLPLADLHALAGLGDHPGQTNMWRMLDSPAVIQNLSEDGARRLTHVATVMAWARDKRDRLALRVWVEQIWMRLGGPGTLDLDSRLRDAERFFELLQEAELEGVGLETAWLDARLAGLFAACTSPDARLQVMTLHKAKGLEFDWVFIPALARATRGDTRDILLWDEYNSPQGERGFLLAADDHSQERDPSLYNFLKHQRRRKALLETTRLLYVGATRAVKRLFLSACLKVPEDEGAVVAGDFREPAEGTLLAPIWPTFLAQAQVHQPTGSASLDTFPEPAPLKRIRSIPTQATRAAAASPVVANIPLRPDNRIDRFVGTVIHLALEELSQRATLPGRVDAGDQRHWQRALRDLGLHGAELSRAARRVTDHVTATLQDKQWGRWLLQSTHPEAHSEFALTHLCHGDAATDIVIDRTFIDGDSGIRWIIDYKSSSPQKGESVAAFTAREAETYGEQLRGYRSALHSLGPEPVRCALYFTAISHLFVVSDME